MTNLYIGAMGIISNMTKLNVHSNNIANIETSGFKEDFATFKVFEETYMRSKKEHSNDRIGVYHDQVYVDNVSTNFREGTFQSTQSPLDFSLHDSIDTSSTSFFVVGKEQNTYLTRNGSFMLDVNRTLSTANGGQVLDENGESIVIQEGAKVSLREDGVLMDDTTNTEIAKLQLVSIHQNDLGLLSKEYGGYYRVRTFQEILDNFGPIQGIIDEYDEDVTLRKVFGSIERLEQIRDNGEVAIAGNFTGRIQNHTIETSNVDMSKEMVEIINTQKAIQSSQKVFNILDNILEKEANEVGK